jgi:hypothetical protein
MKTYNWTTQQKKALRGSIKKWERIVAGVANDKGAVDCPCCVIWNSKMTGSGIGCEGCPIKEFTGEDYCWGTPHENKTKWYEKRELKFLKKLYVAGGGK